MRRRSSVNVSSRYGAVRVRLRWQNARLVTSSKISRASASTSLFTLWTGGVARLGAENCDITSRKYASTPSSGEEVAVVTTIGV